MVHDMDLLGSLELARVARNHADSMGDFITAPVVEACKGFLFTVSRWHIRYLMHVHTMKSAAGIPIFAAAISLSGAGIKGNR